MATSNYIVLLLVVLISNVLAIPTISAKGSKLFTSDGAQFYMKGKSQE